MKHATADKRTENRQTQREYTNSKRTNDDDDDGDVGDDVVVGGVTKCQCLNSFCDLQHTKVFHRYPCFLMPHMDYPIHNASC